MKNLISVVLKVGVSATILYFLFRNIGIDAFLKTVASVRPITVVAGALIFIFTQVVSTYRWSVILKKDMDVSYVRLLSIYFIGMFFNNFLPTIVGGDIVKGYYLYRESKRGDISLASIFMDRYSGFVALMVITVAALIPGYALIKDTPLPFFFLLLIGAFVLLSLVIWVGPLHNWAVRLLAGIHLYGINKKIETFYKVLMGYKARKDILLKIFICSMLVQGGIIAAYYIVGRGLGITAGLGYYFLFIPLTTTVSMLPVSLSGLGIREGAFVYLFTGIGAPKEQALTLSLLWFIIMALVSLLGGIEYLRRGGRPPAPPEDEETQLSF